MVCAALCIFYISVMEVLFKYIYISSMLRMHQQQHQPIHHSFIEIGKSKVENYWKFERKPSHEMCDITRCVDNRMTIGMSLARWACIPCALTLHTSIRALTVKKITVNWASRWPTPAYGVQYKHVCIYIWSIYESK